MGLATSLIYRINENRGARQLPGIEPRTPGLCSQCSAAELYNNQTTTSPHNLLNVLLRWYWHAFSLFSHYNIFTPKWNKNSNRSLWTATTRRSTELVYPSCVESHFKTHLIIGASLSKPHTIVVYWTTCIDRPTDRPCLSHSRDTDMLDVPTPPCHTYVNSAVRSGDT